MNPDELSSVAVVNGGADRVAVWHVAAEPVVQTARLCGAWVTNDLGAQRHVVAARKVVLLGEEPSDYIKALLTHAQGVVDCKATLVAIEQHIEGLDQIHRASLTPRGSRRAPISWPELGQVPERNSLPPVPVGVVEDPLIRSTIAMARWLACLADTWSAIETIRASKAHLFAHNPALLPVPFVLAADN